jgi:hypothetical protein
MGTERVESKKVMIEVEWNEVPAGYFIRRGETGLFVPAEDARAVGAYLTTLATGKMALHVMPKVA